MPAMKKAPSGNISLGVLPELIGFQLRMAQIAMFEDFSESLGDLEMTPGLFGVLVIIEANPDLKQSELARATHLDRSTVVSVIDNLERRNLVERRAAPNDRRSNALRLTTEGGALLRKVKQKVGEHEKRLVAGFSAAERQALVKLLKKIFPENR